MSLHGDYSEFVARSTENTLQFRCKTKDDAAVDRTDDTYSIFDASKDDQSSRMLSRYLIPAV